MSQGGAEYFLTFTLATLESIPWKPKTKYFRSSRCGKRNPVARNSKPSDQTMVVSSPPINSRPISRKTRANHTKNTWAEWYCWAIEQNSRGDVQINDSRCQATAEILGWVNFYNGIPQKPLSHQGCARPDTLPDVVLWYLCPCPQRWKSQARLQGKKMCILCDTTKGYRLYNSESGKAEIFVSTNLERLMNNLKLKPPISTIKIRSHSNSPIMKTNQNQFKSDDQPEKGDHLHTMVYQ